MRGLSCSVKPTKSVSRGKRFDIVWEPPSMKLPWDCSWSVLGGWRVIGWTGKRPKGQYGSVKLEISNWRKISAFKANKPFANKTLRAGQKIRVFQSKSMAWKLFFRNTRVTLCKKDTVSLFKKGIREVYEWLTVRVGQNEREFRDTGQVVLQETYL